MEEQNVAQPLDSGEAPPTASMRLAPPRAEPSLSAALQRHLLLVLLINQGTGVLFNVIYQVNYMPSPA